ncbi:MAG: hypothetical protein ACI9XO_001671, partial [Paraglaciecola sp.]
NKYITLFSIIHHLSFGEDINIKTLVSFLINGEFASGLRVLK